jgi:hypothetical protein
MQLSKQTVDMLKAFAAINTNLVIKPGKKFATMSASKDIFAEYEGEDDFSKQVAVFNLNELLGVIGSFSKPELDLDDKAMTVKEGKAKVKYVYAEESLLTTPTKSLQMPTPDVEFDLSAETLAQLKKMSGILAVEDIAFVGDGKKVIAKVFDAKNPTGNSFDIDLETKTTEKFNVMFKVEKLKLPDGGYKVELSSKKISRFTHSAIKLSVFVAIEATSTFG